MTKNDVKLLCETDQQLQWWAMVLFAEISELMIHGHKYGQAEWDCVQMKVEEFPKIVVQRALEKAKQESEPVPEAPQ